MGHSRHSVQIQENFRQFFFFFLSLSANGNGPREVSSIRAGQSSSQVNKLLTWAWTSGTSIFPSLHLHFKASSLSSWGELMQTGLACQTLLLPNEGLQPRHCKPTEHLSQVWREKYSGKQAWSLLYKKTYSTQLSYRRCITNVMYDSMAPTALPSSKQYITLGMISVTIRAGAVLLENLRRDLDINSRVKLFSVKIHLLFH